MTLQGAGFSVPSSTRLSLTPRAPTGGRPGKLYCVDVVSEIREAPFAETGPHPIRGVPQAASMSEQRHRTLRGKFTILASFM